MTTHKNTIISALKTRNDRSAWDRGVTAEAVSILENIESDELPRDAGGLECLLLNGASSWDQYSWGGCSLCYSSQIAARYCTPSELKRKNYGALPPNSCEDWLDLQARACNQAFRRIWRTILKAA